jgi:hypothetical protein
MRESPWEALSPERPVEKMIVPSGPQAPLVLPKASQIRRDELPVGDVTRRPRSVKKPIPFPSGDTKGAHPPLLLITRSVNSSRRRMLSRPRRAAGSVR